MCPLRYHRPEPTFVKDLRNYDAKTSVDTFTNFPFIFWAEIWHTIGYISALSENVFGLSLSLLVPEKMG